MTRAAGITILGIITTLNTFSQISPPGLGKTLTAMWMAFSFRQPLDSANKKQSVTYIGTGRMSDPDNRNPFEKQGILVINEEFYNQFHPHWQYSTALSYRWQNEYAAAAPFESKNPAARQEIRLYGRLNYILKTHRLRYVNTLRVDLRSFYTPEFVLLDEPFQQRTRIRTQLTINLDQKKQHYLITSAEALFSITKENTSSTAGWSDYQYRESRICLFYSFKPTGSAVIYNVGYMNNLVGSYKPHSAHYIAFDMIWENPLNLFKGDKIPRHNENLE